MRNNVEEEPKERTGVVRKVLDARTGALFFIVYIDNAIFGKGTSACCVLSLANTEAELLRHACQHLICVK